MPVDEVCAETGNGRGRGTDIATLGRRGIHAPSVLWQPADESVSARAGLSSQPQACTTADASVGPRRYGAGTEYQPSTPRAPGLSLSRGLEIERPNQVWGTDITYLRMARGFVYLTAIMDWYSRKVLAWRISNTLDAAFCVDCLEDALRHFGTPDIFNTDQGSQFTSEAFTGALAARGIRISMDGRGRAADNIFVERLWRSVKYEEIYLKDYVDVPALLVGLTVYFGFYNGERPHQALAYHTPDRVYATGQGGGAKIVDKFGEMRKTVASTMN